MKRTQMNRGTVQLQRTGRWRAKLTAKRQEKRETRAAWAVAVKARHRRCRFVLEVFGGGRMWFLCTAYSTDAHHLLARSQGGPDEMWNGLGLCRLCHRWVHDNRSAAQARGLLAHVGDCSELPA